jgi:integrase
MRASEPHGGRRRRSPGTRDVIPPSESIVLRLAAAGPEWLRAMVLVSAFTGLRLFEVAGLRNGDLLVPADGDGWRVVVRCGKGGYSDEVSVAFEPAVSVLLERVAVTGDGERLVVTTIGTPVTRQYVARAFAPVAMRVGFDGTFHALRHFHACWLLDRGVAPVDVAAQLRHHDRGEEVMRRYGRHRSVRAALGRVESAGV